MYRCVSICSNESSMNELNSLYQTCESFVNVPVSYFYTAMKEKSFNSDCILQSTPLFKSLSSIDQFPLFSLYFDNEIQEDIVLMLL